MDNFTTYVSWLALVVVLMVEVQALTSGFIHGVTHPDNLVMARDAQGVPVFLPMKWRFTLRDRVRMTVMRWMYLSPSLHGVLHLYFGIRPVHRGSSVAMYSVMVSATVLWLGYSPIQAAGVGALCGLTVFASMQGRQYAAAVGEVNRLDALRAKTLIQS